LRSLDADAFHSKHAITGPTYLQCTARFMGDDCVNICGDYHMIMASQGNELRVLAKGNMNIRPDDPVELVLYTGERLADTKAVAVKAAGAIREDERAFLAAQRMDTRLKSEGLCRAFTFDADERCRLPCVRSASRSPRRDLRADLLLAAAGPSHWRNSTACSPRGHFGRLSFRLLTRPFSLR
jgi:hypothetical protein